MLLFLNDIAFIFKLLKSLVFLARTVELVYWSGHEIFSFCIVIQDLSCYFVFNFFHNLVTQALRSQILHLILEGIILLVIKNFLNYHF